MRAMKTYELDVAVTRGEGIESEHRVHAAVVGDDDELLGAARDPDSFTYWRSCAKPFQIIPFLSSGGFDALGWGDEQLAVSCASHGGEPEHVAIVERMLHDIGLEEGDLACGPHDPSSQRGAKIVRESGGRPTRFCLDRRHEWQGRVESRGRRSALRADTGPGDRGCDQGRRRRAARTVPGARALAAGARRVARSASTEAAGVDAQAGEEYPGRMRRGNHDAGRRGLTATYEYQLGAVSGAAGSFEQARGSRLPAG